MDLLLGVDCGQTTTKVGLYDVEGREVAWAGRRSPVSSPRPGWQERDPEVVWSDVAAACREVVERSGAAPADVLGIAVSGYTDGLCLLDDDGRPVRPAILATDDRAADLAGEYDESEAVGRGARLLELTGQLPFAAASPVVLAWLAVHEPPALARARWLVGCKDWVRYRMTGVVATDRSEASASFTAVATGAWSSEALELYEVGAHERLLPPIASGTDAVARLTAAAAAELGLVEGTPVVAGAHDVDAAALGTASVADGATSAVLGTFCINQVVAARPVVDAAWQARSFTTAGRWVHMSTSATGTVALDWFVQTSYAARVGTDGLGTAVTRALTRPDRPAPPTFVPYVVGAPRGQVAGGSLIGLRGWHDADDLLRGVLEGIVFNHRRHLEPLAAAFGTRTRLGLCGGGARNAAWAQLLADVTATVVEVPAAHEVGAHGSALLAGVGTGVYDDVDDAVRAVRVGRRHEPRAEVAEELEERYAAWRAATGT